MIPKNSPAETDTTQPLGARLALRLALIGWALGWGLSILVGVLMALYSGEHGNAPSALVLLRNGKSAAMAICLLPMALAAVIEKNRFHNLGLAELRLALLTSFSGLPFIWILSDDPLLAVKAVPLMILSLGWLVYPAFQRMTGFTSGIYKKYMALAKPSPRRLNLTGMALLLGYLGCYTLAVVGVTLAGLYCTTLLSTTLTWASYAGTLRLMAALWSMWFTFDLGFTMRRNFPTENRWRLSAVFAAIVMAIAALKYRFGWAFFEGMLMKEIPLYVFLALFFFTLSFPRRWEQAKGTEKKANG